MAFIALYIAVFVLLVIIQFPLTGPSSMSSGSLTIRTAPNKAGDGLRLAEIKAAGLMLSFTERNPLRYISIDGSEKVALPISSELNENELSVFFNDGTEIRAIEGDDGSIYWNLICLEPIKSAEIKFSQSSSRLLPPSIDGLPRLSAGKRVYVLDGFASGREPGDFAFIIRNGYPLPIIASPVEQDDADDDIQFMAQKAMTQAEWDNLVYSWTEKLWTAISGDNLRVDAALWMGRDRYEFNEAKFIVFTAEALRRNRINDAQAVIQAVRSNHLESISWQAVPFAGKTATAMAVFEQTNLAEIKELERLLQAKSPELFWKKGLVPFLFDRAPYALAQEVMALARSSLPAPTNMVQALRILEAYMDARHYLEDEENPFGKAFELADRMISPAIKKAGNSYFLETSTGGACDLLLGIETGMALIKLGETGKKTIYTGIGQSLIASALGRADESGAIPRQLIVKDGAIYPMADILSPVTIYPIIVSNPYYPKAISFYRELGPGAWAWTAAPGFRVEKNGSQTVFLAQYPEGASHYLALYGIKPYLKLQLYEMDYNMDPGFEGYNASGYWYKRASSVLYVKMRHKAPSEAIRLFY